VIADVGADVEHNGAGLFLKESFDDLQEAKFIRTVDI
jgi:hypothetical protein